MKALKKQWLTLVMLAALIATLTLGVVFAFPAHGAVAEAADEDVFANAAMITVSTEQDLKAQVAQADETPMVIQLGENIEMKTLNEETGSGYELVVGRGQAIKLDLNGKTLSVPAKNNSEGYVIVNKGTLSVVDTSEDYQGAVISNGYVSNTNAFEESKDGEIYWWPSKAVVNNYGDLTLDAKLSIQIPQSGGSNDSFNTNAYYFVGSWKGERTYEAKSYLVRNQIDITSYEEDQTVTRASLTVDGGVYDLAYNKLLGNALGIYYTMNHFFLLSEADLTVNGGTFSYSSPFYNSAYFDGFLAELISLEQQTPEIEAQIKEYRHIDITITDGDFGNEKLSKELLYMDASGQWNKDYKYDASIEGESCSIAVSGGVFPMDLSVYTDAAHRMKKGDDGFYSVIPLEDDYIQEYAVAKIELDGEKPTLSGYFDTFDGAWNAVQTRAQTGQSVILTLLKDVESQSLLFEQASGDIRITIDLNGHELKVTQDSMYNTHIRENNVGEDSVGVRTLVVRDTSEKQDGTFNLVYLKDVSNGGISISPKLKFVLESGTITRTGGGFYESPDGWGSTSQNQRSIFYLASIDSSTETLVTIKGGNILSELEGDNGHLISTSQDNFKMRNILIWKLTLSLLSPIFS